MHSLSRRLEKLEARRPTSDQAGPKVPYSALSPAVAELLILHAGEVSQMTLVELDLVETEMRRFTV